ncbi:hypothetical protein ACH5RR_037524 [Cinchona calisaya]|uniref:Uncharacterized protein n=1 Tax=Cinchona calisaya TaxID=153742 RepID=A0ABD2Y7T7_9GENT
MNLLAATISSYQNFIAAPCKGKMISIAPVQNAIATVDVIGSSDVVAVISQGPISTLLGNKNVAVAISHNHNAVAKVDVITAPRLSMNTSKENDNTVAVVEDFYHRHTVFILGEVRQDLETME